MDSNRDFRYAHRYRNRRISSEARLGIANANRYEVLSGDRLRNSSTVSHQHCRLKTEATLNHICSLIPIAIMRLQSLRTSLTSDEYLLDASSTEYYTQAGMTFSLIAATIPCLRLFMEAAKTGLLGISMWGPGTTSGSYTKSYTAKESGIMSKTRITAVQGREDAEDIQLRDWKQGSSSAHAHATSGKISIASDGSETAIIVRQTADVRYE